MSVDLEQVKKDFENGVTVSRSTWAEVLVIAMATLNAPRGVGRGEYSADPQKEWDTFWRDIVAPGGLVDVEQVKKELSDFSMLLHFVPRVYMHATGGICSYAQTLPDTVCSLIDDHVSNIYADDEDGDSARMDWLESAVENGHVGACFEIDGGVHLTLEGVGEEPKIYREQNSLRDAIDLAKKG